MLKKLSKVTLLCSLALLPLVGHGVKAQVPSKCSDVMLQAFDYYPQPINIGGTTMTWNDSKWTTLNGQATEIGESFQMIWLPPSGKGEGGATTMGYHPQYYFNQTSTFGSQADLVTLIANLKTKNCKAIADIVINHRSSPTNWCTFATESYNGVTYTPNSSWICTNDESRSTAPAGCNNPTGANDSGETYDAARDLDHTNSAVRDNIKAYMQFLKNDIGYAGWRYDVAKGYGQNYLAEYNDAAAASFSVGEVMEQDYNYCKNWVGRTNNKSTVFDFPAQTGIREALNNSGSPDYTKLVSSGQPRGLIAAEMKKYAVTFVENHDTYRYGLGFYGNIEIANAFILSSPGVPCVYLPHWNKYKTNIKKMIAARKKAGLHSESSVTMLQSANNIYVAEVTGNNGKLIVKLGSGSYTAPSNYILEGSGTDWAIWTNIITNAPVLSADKAAGTYIGGTTVTLSSTSGVAPVKIYYTLDGSTPSSGSTPYSSAISITVNKTRLRAVAIDNGGVKSNEIDNTYITANTPVVIVTPPGGTYIGGTTVTLSSTGGVAPVKIYYTLDSSAPTATKTLYVAPIAINLNNTILKAVAIDAEGTTSEVPMHTYITEEPAGITVKFKAPASWTTVKCYTWGGGLTVTPWPGAATTKDADGNCTYLITGATSYPVNVIFNNNNGNEQTVDLSASTNICWEAGTSTGTAPKKYSANVVSCTSSPVAVISPVGGYYPNGVTVTLSSTGGAQPVKLYYTLDGSIPTAGSTLYTTPFPINTDNVTVKAIAIDQLGVVSPVASETYTKTPQNKIVVSFTAPASWSTVKIYAWLGTTKLEGVWPGNSLTPEPNGSYVYTTDNTNSGFNIVFNNGGSEKTVDILNITGNTCYSTTGTSSIYPVVQLLGCDDKLETKDSKATISIYPNPARESITIESDLNLSEIQIYSISGVLVESVLVSSTKEVISLENLVAGYYSVVAITEEGARTTSKLIKQ